MTRPEKESFAVIHEKLDVIVRGIYGDEENKVKGLLDRQEEDEKKWKTLEPLLESAPEIPKMVSSYRFWTNRTTWIVIGAVFSGITSLIMNWDKIKVALFQ